MTSSPTDSSRIGVATSRAASETSLVTRLRSIAARSLARMYLPGEKTFVFRLRRAGDTIVSEGVSPRYTAMTLIGLAEEDPSLVSAILGTDDLASVYRQLLAGVDTETNLGNVALTLWAGHALGIAERTRAADRLIAMHPEANAQSTVELAWVVAALSLDSAVAENVREAVAQRLLSALNPATHVFPHMIGGERAIAMTSHVSCFADLVYPIHALSLYAQLTGSPEARAAVAACADYICRVQGPAGQWWWHYDYRTGQVLERYPVYAVHQDAMAPMALFAAATVTGRDYDGAIRLGLDWLQESPELGRGTLVDDKADLIWRKVARREPRKLTRILQTLASRLHSHARMPGADLLFPPVAIDTEDRPYHLGWLFYAFPPSRAQKW
jgi:hypothetical protein